MIIVHIILVVLTIMIMIKGMFAINTIDSVPWEHEVDDTHIHAYIPTYSHNICMYTYVYIYIYMYI